jgi:hypothetical protein
MAYTIQNAAAGLLPIANIDAGFLSPASTSSGSTTYAPTSPATLGQIVTAIDPIFGAGEFILLTGVATNAIGTVVQYDGTTFVPAIPTAVNANKSGMPLAVSMTANTSATNWSWYQISGTAVVKKTTVKFSNKQAIGFISTGVIGKNASGVQIIGARTANTTSVASAVTTIAVTIQRPHMMGRIT